MCSRSDHAQGNIFGDQAQGIGHRTVANYLTDTPNQIIQGVQQLIDETKNSTHAHPNSLARNLTTQHISTEVVDVVDEFDQVIGNAPRTEVYAEGLGHRIVHVLLFNSEGKLGLQLRSESAHYLPGHWSSAAGGHVQTGEDYLSAAVRECGEELGVNLPIEEIKKYVYTDQKLCKHTVLFKTVYDGPFQTNPAEVQGIEFFSLKEIDDMIAGGDKIHPELIAALRIFRQKL